MHNFKRNLLEPDATALLADLRRGVLSVTQLVESHLARIERTQPLMNGATQIFRDEAMALARQLERSGDPSLPLFGLPCSVKETFGLAGQQVTAGSLRMPPEPQSEDAEVVRRLKAAGAVVVARSNVPEFAMTAESSNLRFGRTANPLDLSCVAGGSSGGEGALLGSGGSAFGVGSDILGSIRIPAAFCGVVGFKPHSAAVSRRGAWPEVTGNTQSWLALGPLTRSVRDAELVYNVIADRPAPASAKVGGRLIVPRNFPLSMREPCIEQALAAARRVLLNQGYREDAQDFSETRQLYLHIPKLILDDFYDDWIRLLSTPEHGRYSPFKELLRQLAGKPSVDAGLLRWTLLGPLLKPRRAATVTQIAAQFADARTRFHAMLGIDGVIVLPTVGLLAPKHGEMNRLSLRPGVNGLFTAHTMGNYLDLPAISIPAWKFQDPISGLPPSVSVLCAPGAEAQLFGAAKRIEAALN